MLPTEAIPPAVRLEDRPCPLGCDRSDVTVCIGQDRLLGLPGRFAVVRCTGCGLLRTNPRPSPDTISYYYRDEYGPYQISAAGERGRQFAPPKSPWKAFLRELLELNVHRLPDLPPARMLELGCSAGAYLELMARKGWETSGIEFAPGPARRARERGLRVHIGSVETAPEPAIKYDLIAAWMVLEHLHEPVRALRTIGDWAKKRAWLVGSVPNAGGWEFRIFRERWYALHLPHHLYHFTPNTLSRVLERGGWRLVGVHHQRVLANLFPSLGYALQDLHALPSLSSRLVRFSGRTGRQDYYLYPFAYLLSLAGLTGRMTFWARKIDA